jgi:hypothetical protein
MNYIKALSHVKETVILEGNCFEQTHSFKVTTKLMLQVSVMLMA